VCVCVCVCVCREGRERGLQKGRGGGGDKAIGQAERRGLSRGGGRGVLGQQWRAKWHMHK
jgi:hypothetical protein